MPNTPNNSSFIPKQGPVRQPRQTATRQIQILSVVAYIAIGAAAVASVAVFFYNMHIQNQLAVEAQNLSDSMSGFNTDDMERVREFNMRLSQARERINTSVSVSSIFSALEQSIVGTVSVESINVSREGDNSLLLDAQLNTDNFDSALFQRGVLERSFIAETVTVENLSLGASSEETSGTPDPAVSLETKITVPLDRVINRQGERPMVSSVTPALPLATSTLPDDTSVSEETSNEPTI